MLVLYLVAGALASAAAMAYARFRHLEKLARRQHDVIGHQRDVLNMYQDQVRDIFKYLPIPMAMVDPDGYLVRVNVKFADALGYTPRELENVNFKELTASMLDEDVKYFRRLKRGEINSYRMAKSYWHRKGHTIEADLTAIAVRSAATGKMQYAFGIFIPKTGANHVDVNSSH